jgi:hypothetical protein
MPLEQLAVWFTVATTAEHRVLAVVHEGALKRLGHVRQASEVGVIAASLPGEHGVHRVVQVVAPLRVESVATQLKGAHETRIVEARLGDQHEASAQPRLQRVHRVRQLLQDVHGRGVEDGVHGVEAKAVQVVVVRAQLQTVGGRGYARRLACHRSRSVAVAAGRPRRTRPVRGVRPAAPR